MSGIERTQIVRQAGNAYCSVIVGEGGTMLAAVTTCFNPCGYRRLLENHATFAASLHGCELFVIEQSFDGRFHTSAQFQICGQEKNLMWQKEALINEAVRRLPVRFTRIAWLDSDIVFDNSQWAEAAVARLNDVPVVQLFSRVVYMGRDGITPERKPESGFIASLTERRRSASHANPGLAWAARREFFEQHGLAATHVLGGGDVMLTHALTGRFSLNQSRTMNPRWQQAFLRWAAEVYRDVRGRIGMVSGSIRHLHHGEIHKRQYVQRWRQLAQHDFDPDRDVRTDQSGQLEWASCKPELHAMVRNYFVDRNDDE